MYKKSSKQLLFLLACTVLQNNTLNAMKRSIDLISGSDKIKQPPSKKQKLVPSAAALVCSFCDKSFLYQSKLTVHERTHTGEKPFSCSLCNKNFFQKCHLTAHERTHTGEKPFSCSLCSKSFIQKGDLTKHGRVHTGEKSYSCSLCDKRFTVQSNLIVHERTHTEEKPFSCSVCDTSFSQKGHLTAHERIHTGEKPFHCSLCDKSFTRKDNLTRHMKIHTKNSTPTITSSKTSSQKAPTNIVLPKLVAPLAIQKSLEKTQSKKNKIIEETMEPRDAEDFMYWTSSNHFS